MWTLACAPAAKLHSTRPQHSTAQQQPTARHPRQCSHVSVVQAPHFLQSLQDGWGQVQGDQELMQLAGPKAPKGCPFPLPLLLAFITALLSRALMQSGWRTAAITSWLHYDTCGDARPTLRPQGTCRVPSCQSGPPPPPLLPQLMPPPARPLPASSPPAAGSRDPRPACKG